MSAFASLVMATACRSNHHRLAIDAVRLLEGRDADAWRNLFLHHYQALLEGAKAPDDRFKDFKNHVLHVREGDWGGAPGAAREWYNRTVRALKAGEWKMAVYNAGVMSHYVVDPVQPFHTGQTETEGVIHRAVEWSFSKSYAALRAILEVDQGGFPDVLVPDGDDWLEQMVRAGALKSNPHYETILTHYDVKAGAKDPPAGLDQELKDVVASLIGYAAAMLARILERAIAESAATPPKVDLTLDAVFAVMAAPIRGALAAIEDVTERATVAAMYEEYRKTGKVRATLAQDDAAVRRLHAQEVLKTPLSSLDAQWPEETGAAHATGAPARKTPKPKRNIGAAPVRARDAKNVPPAEQVDKAVVAPDEMKQSAPVTASTLRTLDAASPVMDAPSIGPKTAARLEKIGVRTVGDLLCVTPEDAAGKISAGHINAQVIRAWQAQARLAMGLAGMTSSAAQILVAAGADTLERLGAFESGALQRELALVAATPDGQRMLRDAPLPSVAQLEAWIEAAKQAAKSSAGREAA